MEAAKKFIFYNPGMATKKKNFLKLLKNWPLSSKGWVKALVSGPLKKICFTALRLKCIYMLVFASKMIIMIISNSVISLDAIF